MKEVEAVIEAVAARMPIDRNRVIALPVADGKDRVYPLGKIEVR